ncbi:hypothetical protein HK098_003379 [Nowakowskiella sp. JEL0407]|nr:hypothetical protein HK098_003379 [Nowakowskiella sp. JEL0407]
MKNEIFEILQSKIRTFKSEVNNRDKAIESLEILRSHDSVKIQELEDQIKSFKTELNAVHDENTYLRNLAERKNLELDALETKLTKSDEKKKLQMLDFEKNMNHVVVLKRIISQKNNQISNLQKHINNMNFTYSAGRPSGTTTV